MLDLGRVAKETEGYLPRDLALLLERAIHANAQHRGPNDQGEYPIPPKKTFLFKLSHRFKRCTVYCNTAWTLTYGNCSTILKMRCILYTGQ